MQLPHFLYHYKLSLNSKLSILDKGHRLDTCFPGNTMMGSFFFFGNSHHLLNMLHTPSFSIYRSEKWDDDNQIIAMFPEVKKMIKAYSFH